jgi:hypothetical protein
MVADVSSQLVTSFAECLKAQITASAEDAQAAVARQSKPVSGLRLGLLALLRAIARPFRGKERSVS